MRSARPDFIIMAFAACLVAAASVGAAQAQTATDPPKQAAQPSPQGPTGPLNTGSGGAPAESPQGETPPNMQSAPAGSGEPSKGK
jgi:hypothetical protein